MLGVDDEGNKFELAPDPMNEELQEQFKDIAAGKPEIGASQVLTCGATSHSVPCLR